MNTRRILVPDDFSDASRDALRYARALGSTGCHELHLLHVVPDARREPWASDVEELDLASLTEEWVRDAGIRLQRSAGELRSAFDVRTDVRLGTAPEQIVAYAAEHQADMIVLGAHRDRRSDEWLRGSIAERVVRKASCPVLTVPGGGCEVTPIDEARDETRGEARDSGDSRDSRDAGDRPVIRSILIPVDFSTNAELALRRGLTLARELGATAHVLYVYDPPWTRSNAYTPPPAHVTEELRYRAERLLGHGIARHHGLPLHVHATVRVGDPYTEIVYYAGEIRAGLIVLGTHSRNTIGRHLLGSVAQKVLRRAPCPVLTVCDEAIHPADEKSFVNRGDTMKVRGSVTASVLLAIAFITTSFSTTFTGTAFAQAPRAITIGANDQMKFEPATIQAKPGEKLRIVLKPVGTMPKIAMSHNFVILKPGSNEAKFAEASAMARPDFIAPALKSQVLVATPLAGNGETVSAEFTAPAKPGKYAFICTFPGHYMAGMKGVLVVK